MTNLNLVSGIIIWTMVQKISLDFKRSLELLSEYIISWLINFTKLLKLCCNSLFSEFTWWTNVSTLCIFSLKISMSELLEGIKI